MIAGAPGTTGPEPEGGSPGQSGSLVGVSGSMAQREKGARAERERIWRKCRDVMGGGG